MATVGLGISWDRNSTQELGGVRAYHGVAHTTPYIIWHSDTGTDWIDHYDLSVAWKYVPKGMAGFADSGSYGTYGERVWCGLTAAQCNPNTKSGSPYTWWNYPLASVGGADGTPLVGDEVCPNGWSFSDRIYDGVVFRVAVRAYYKEGLTDQYGSTYSRVEVESVLAYMPTYDITSCSMSASDFVINYTATDWTRTDDRYALEKVMQDGVNHVVYSGPGNVFGVVSELGVIRVPLDRFIEVPEQGSASVTVRFNEGFRDEGGDNLYAYWAGDLVNTSVCNTPRVWVYEATEERLLLSITDSLDKGKPFDYVNVYVEGESYLGRTFTWDAGDVNSLSIPYPPLGVPIVVQAVAYTDAGDFSDTVTLNVDPIGEVGEVARYIAIDAEDGSVSVRCRFNVSQDETFEQEQVAVKFSGRDRESVAYGIGGSVTGKVSCDIITSGAGDLVQGRRDFERLAFAGTCVLRTADGERKRIAVTDVGESWDVVERVKRMTVSYREVL